MSNLNKRKNFSEKVKNIIIILLFVSAVFLGWESRLFGNSSVELSVFSNLIDDQTASSGNGGTQEAEKKTIGEARPVSIAVTGSTGAHYGVKYKMDEISLIYDSTFLLFGQALGSEQTPIEVYEQSWRAALKSPGVYFEYMSPIQLSVLGGWFGAKVTDSWGGLSVRRLCIAAKDGKILLYFQDDTTGQFYAAQTDIAADNITKLTDTYAANEAFFTFEIISSPSLIDPYTLLMPEVSEHPLIEVKNPLNDKPMQIDVLKNFGVSEHLMPITYADGSREYIDIDFTIKMSPDGTVGYTLNSSQESPPAYLEKREAIELARRAVSDSIGNYCGDAKIYFNSVSSSREGEYQIKFIYVIAGGQIYLGKDGYAATVTIKNGFISEMELHFRNYSISSGEKKELLPEIQAAAAAGGAFMLSYTDNGNDSLEPSWIVS